MKKLTYLFLVIILTGCVASDPALMTPSEISVAKQIIGKAQVNVVGSNERIISNESMKIAIENAILQNSIFSNDNKEYRLNVSVLAIENPLMGVNLTAELRIRWTLFDVENGIEVFNEVVANEYTATMSDSIVAAQRLRIANENVVKENIKIALEQISEQEY